MTKWIRAWYSVLFGNEALDLLLWESDLWYTGNELGR